MLGRTDSRARAIILLLVFVVVAGALGVRLAYWQVLRRDELSAMAVKQSSMKVELPARRGSIYDRSGTVVLATSVQRDRLAATPKLLTPQRRIAVADALVGMLALQGEAAINLRTRMTSEREYVVLARGLDAKLSDRIRELSAGDQPTLAGLLLEPEQERLYPQPGGGPETSLAAHLLGSVNREGTGQYGVEQYYQDRLAGTPRIVAAQRDAAGNEVPDSSSVLQAGARGEDLLLTIDAGLQVAVEQELLATWIADRAKRVSAVVMDPYSGEIYAYGSYPSYDANDYQSVGATEPGRFVDPLVSTVYEPGSVFKMMTATAALGDGVVTLATKLKDVGTLRLDDGKTKIDNANRKGMGVMKFKDAIAYSRNVVAAKVALKLGRTTDEAARKLFATWTRLGFGAKTGLDVAHEVDGLLRDPATTTWRQIDLANGAFGQGVAVTPMQLAQSYAAMVNGGVLVKPHLVRQIGTETVEPVSRGRVMSPKLSGTLVKLMRNVIDTVDFYRDRTVIPGYDVGGKTGTAQIWDADKKAWKINKFNYSFIGYIGREKGHPDLVVAVRIEEGTPTVIRVGQLEMPVMSFELFRRIAHDAISTPDLIPEDRKLPDDLDVEQPVTAACATLDAVTEPGRSPIPGTPARPAGAADPAPSMTAEDLALATGGRLLRSSDRPIRGGAVDSRLVTNDSLFIALPGERTDGHRYLGQAAAAGAAALLVSREPLADEPALDSLGDLTVVLVPDTLRGLHATAAAWRRRFSPLVVGVTGSIAKTSTKEAVAGVLEQRFVTLRTEGNRNNEVGMPLTVLDLGPAHEAAVLEMGMYTGGEIRELAAIGRPSIGIVTAVQPVHLSRIGSLDAIEDAKAELVEALPAADRGGVAILNADDPRVRRMGPRTRARVSTYGFAPDADVRADEVVSLGFEGMRFRLVTPAGERDVRIPGLGRLAVHNALAAAAAGLAGGMTLDEIVPGLAASSRAEHRSVVMRAGGVVIVDDAYNASPASVTAALELLSGLPGRHVAVLGAMRELGTAHDAGHVEAGEAAGTMLDRLVVVDGGADGEAAGIVDGALAAGLARDAITVVADPAAAVAALRDELTAGDVVLVKASRGIELERVVDGLVAALGGGAPAR